MKMVSAAIFGIMVAVWSALGTIPVRQARAQEADASFYKGKTVRIAVGFSAGGGLDVYARLIAPFLAKALDANVVIENQPGAGGLISLNSMAVSPPDGLRISLLQGSGVALSQITGDKAVRFDLSAFEFLGNVDAPPWVWLVAPSSRLRTPADINRQARLSWASTGAISGLTGAASITCAALNLDCRVVVGYPSTNDGALAMSRGEMDSMYGMDSSIGSFLQGGQARPLVTIGRERSKLYPDVPTVYESFTLTAEQKWLFDFQATLQDLGRILIAPPGVPAGRLQILREAVKRAPASVSRDAALRLLRNITPQETDRIKTVLAKYL